MTITRRSLEGLKVLVTRPEAQATSLVNALRERGAIPVALPTIEIAPVQDAADLLANIDHYDDLIFISSNAVNHALKHIQPTSQRIIAIGKNTAVTLQAHGITAEITPLIANSEGLLAEPALQTLDNRNMLIIRGNGGRELLADTLRKRGAHVTYANIYTRECPSTDCSKLNENWRATIDVVTTTSNQVIDNLLMLCGKTAEILRTPVLVVSSRCAEHARSLGFIHILQSDGASTDAILACLESASLFD